MRSISGLGVALAAAALASGSWPTGGPKPKKAGKVPPLPTGEPQRENYPSRQAYRADMRLWLKGSDWPPKPKKASNGKYKS